MRSHSNQRRPGGYFTIRDYVHDPLTGLMLPVPVRVRRVPNTLVNGGGALMLDLFIGAGGTVFNNANSYIGVGDSSSATVATMTDLQGTLAGTIAISSSTNATPIVLTTGSAHGLTAGDTVTIAGHTTNTNANGTWVITVPSSTTLGLVGSSGNGVGGATGTIAKGNRFRSPMDSTFPSRSGQILTWEATFAPGQAEWGTGIQEISLFNGFVAATSTMFARAVQNLGVKAAGTTQKVQYTYRLP